MKSLLSRKFSRSLSSLVSSSRSHQDNIVSIPDYYRDTRREIYGPCWSTREEAHCSGRTMESPYDDDNESYRSSVLLDIGLPGDEGQERKPTCYVHGFPFTFRSYAERGAPPSARKKIEGIDAFRRVAFRVLSAFCSRNHPKN